MDTYEADPSTRCNDCGAEGAHECPRTTFIDPDFRRDPKTETYCCRCQKDINGAYSWVYLRADGATAVHPADVDAGRLPDDIGWCRIGPECVRKVGAEWVRARRAEVRHE